MRRASCLRSTRLLPFTLIVLALAATPQGRASTNPVDRLVTSSPGSVAATDARDARRDQARAGVERALANLPVAFVENRGQLDRRVRYYAQAPGRTFYVTPEEVVLAFETDQTHGLALALRFVGANRAAAVSGDMRAAGNVSYIRGSDPSRWQTDVPRYAHVVVREVWPGIDLRMHEEAGALKYEFSVRPGARAADIRLEWRGARGVAIEAGSGALAIDTDLGVLRDRAPVAWQTIDGARVPVQSRYALGKASTGRFGFAVGDYRHDRELVIDPGIEYATFLGGSSHEIAAGVEVDAAGNAYVVGTTQSPDFPTTAGAFRRTGAASNFSDVFVTKINAAGTALLYSTFVGGSNLDFGRRIAIDAAGNAYVTGQTKSSNFPTTGGAFDRTFNIANCPRCGVDQYDSFAFKLNASGSALVYSTFLGGTDIDDARGIAVDGAGNAYVTGETLSPDFPTTAGAFDRTYAGNYDVFLTRLNATGSALVYSTFLGGTQVDNGERVAVDGAGSAYVMGFTSSTNFPVTAGAFDTTANGAFDVFVTKMNAAGSAPVYSTYLGGQGFESGGGLDVDASGNAYVSGGTGSLDFPTTAGAFDTTSDGSDAFLTKLNAAGAAAIYSTVLGGSGGDGANGVAVDTAGRAWLTGITNSIDFPVTSTAAQGTFSGVADVFVAELSADATTLLYATYIGGTQSEGGDDIAVAANGDAYIGGHTYSMDFPVTLGALDTIFNGDPSIFWGDAIVVRIAADTDESTPPAPPGVPATPVLLSPFNGDTPQQPVTFDWSDAASASSYTIQIDTASNFAAPLVRDQTVTASIFVASGLATTTQFWRVRGVNSAGTPGPWSAVRSFTPQAPPPPATLGSITTIPSSVVGGVGASGTAVLSVPAPEGGAVIALSSSAPGIVSVPATATVPGNTFTANFAIATTAVSTTTVVTITGSYNNTTRTTSLTVTPADAPSSLQNLVLSPSSVTGGSSLQGVVLLAAAAPAGGAPIALSSSNQSLVTVPGSVTVAAGATSAVFAITTSTVTASTPVTVTASAAGVTRTATLTLTPSAPPPPPPQSATLTVTATGRGGERVTSSPAGLSVATGASGSASFTTGASITLSVSNGRDAVWSGACSSNGSKRKTCTFTLNAAASVSANVQ